MKITALARRSSPEANEGGPTIKRLVSTLFLFSIFYFLFSASPAIAQTQISNQAASQQTNSTIPANTNPDVPKNLHTWTQNVMIEVMAAMTCQLAGVDPVNPNQQCLGVDPKTNKIGFVQNGGGAIGVMGNLIAMTYTPPLRTSDYFGYLAQNFGITKTAYAQTTGTGFDGIKPLLGLWVAFRNIVYMFFVAVFIIIGFGIMLRVNIDPRTVMAISNQLPKMIIAILLVTFSFAISGFLIDIMWVSMHVTYNIIAGAKVQNADVTELSPAKIAGKTVMDANGKLNAAGLAFDVASGGGDMIRSMLDIHPLTSLINFDFKNILKLSGGCLSLSPPCLKAPTTIDWGLPKFQGGIIDVLIDAISAVVAWSAVKDVATLANVPLLGALPALASGAIIFGGVNIGLRTSLPFLIIFIIILTALIWALFRVWFALIKAYIFILINVIIAPFWIIAGLIPGSSINFSGWLREMLGNLSVFPVTYGMLLLGRVFFDTFSHPVAGQQPFTPPLLGNLGDTNFLAAIIGVGVILLTPQVLEMMHGLFKVEGFKYGAGINQAIGVGTGATNVAGHASSIGNMMFGFSHTPLLNKLPWLKNFGAGAPAQHTP